MSSLKDSDIRSLGPVGKKFMEFASGKLIGQDKAIRRIAKALDQYASGLRIDNKPIYVSLLIGGPGSGKTLLAGLVAEFWFGSPDALTVVSCGDFFQTNLIQWDLNRFDYHNVRSMSKPMQELLDGHNLNAENRMAAAENLARARAAGVEDSELQKLQDLFQEADKKFEESFKKYQPIVNGLRSVVVFDHIEDGKPNVQDQLSRILEKGLSIREMEDGQSVVSFRNAMIFITCNDCVHLEDDKKAKKLGFNTDGKSNTNNGDSNRRYLCSIEEINNYFSPRLLSHLDRVEIFQGYTDETLLQILEIFIRDFHTELAKKFPVELSIEDTVKLYIVAEGKDHPEHGMRLLKRKFDKYIRGQLASLKCNRQIQKGDSISVSLKEEGDKKSVIFRKKQ